MEVRIKKCGVKKTWCGKMFNRPDKEYNFVIDIEFKTKTPLTPRIIEVSNAFGLGVSEEKVFSIYKDFHFDFNDGDLTYITGDSGGGKSLLLKELAKNLIKNHTVINFDDIIIPNDEIIAESIGETLDDGIKLLSYMGLNDAFIFLRKFGELSDGQKYRYKLATALYENPEVLIIDEFCANLDRTTAKVISYNLQRVCRKMKISLFVATTHRDLIDDFNPNIIVDKKYMDAVTITHYEHGRNPISFYDNITFHRGRIDDYKKLSKFHYRTTATNFPYSSIVVAKNGSDLVGVAVLSPPFLQTKGRSIKFEKKYSMMTKEVCSDINKMFIRGSRYIISPKYRGCGLGQLLVNESLKFVPDKKYLEVVTVMGKYTPIFERAGMEKIEISQEADAPTLRLYKWLEEKGLKDEKVHNPPELQAFIDALTPTDKTELKLLMGKVLHHPKIGLSSKDGKRAEVVAQENRYKVVPFGEVYQEIQAYIPKLYTGMTLYYVMTNPNYVEDTKSIANEWLK